MEDLLTGPVYCGTCGAPMVSSDERRAAEHQPQRYVCASAEEPCCGVVSCPAAQIEQLATDAYLRHLGAVDDDEAAAFAEKVNGRGGLSLPGGRRVAFRPELRALWEGADLELRRRLLAGVLKKVIIPQAQRPGLGTSAFSEWTRATPADGSDPINLRFVWQF